MDGLIFPVACSVGIAMVPDDAKTLSGALVVADAAIYEAKRSGRNQVVDRAPPVAAGLPGSDPRVQQYSPSRMELVRPGNIRASAIRSSFRQMRVRRCPAVTGVAFRSRGPCEDW
jgi:hypothetical protein